MDNQIKILHAMNVHNESDILKYNIDWYSSQGIDSVVINNTSTDKTKEVLESLRGKGLLAVKELHTDHFDRAKLFFELTNLIHTYSPDWVVFSDADEFLQPIDQNKNLKKLIEEANIQNYNLIQFHNMEFWMTPLDDNSKSNPLERINHYSYFDSNRYKAFRFYPGFSLVPNNGHAPSLPDGVTTSLSPEKGIMRHYKFRSLDQAYYKIKRIVPEPDKKEFGFHYLKFDETPDFFIITPEKLSKYNNDGNWNLERKFDGNRMTHQELISYLELKNETELRRWFDSRAGVKK